jgi:pSer/pThr/pTyr-binding forkhead associated (FHA) protein
LLNPSDLELVSPTLKPLLHELRQAVANHAEFEGYTLKGEPAIHIDHDERIKSNNCEVTAHAVSVVPVVPTVSETPNEAHRVALPTGEHIELSSHRYTIGRQTTCDIVIDDHNVSRVHAELRIKNGMWYADDRGSTNGTRVNGSLVVEPTLLASGDVISLGSVDVRFE